MGIWQSLYPSFGKSKNKKKLGKKAQQRERGRLAARSLYSEPLEQRMLMAIGPVLQSIDTNTGIDLAGGYFGVAISTLADGSAVPAINEQQLVQLSNPPVGGTFNLTFGGQTTVNIPYNASASTVESDLEALSTIDDVLVTGNGGGPWTVEFQGTQASTNVAQMTGRSTTPLPALDIAPHELTFKFDAGQVIKASSLGDNDTLGGIQIVRAGGDGTFASTFGGAGDVRVMPGFIGVGDHPNEVVFRFAETLPDDLYKIRIGGDTNPTLQNSVNQVFNGSNLPGQRNAIIDFELDLGAQVLAVVPQPITRNPDGSLSQSRDKVEVYFNNDDLLLAAGTLPTSVFQLVFTKDTATNADDLVFSPTSVTYDPATDKAVLTFASALDALPGVTTGAFRLRIGDNDVPANSTSPEAPITTAFGADVADADSSFATARALGSLTNISKILTASIDAQTFTLELPGGSDEPGHRDIPKQTSENHVGGSSGGISVQQYYFPASMTNPDTGLTFPNLINEAQKERAREIFALYSYYSGVEFRETANSGIQIATIDLRAIVAVPPAAGGLGSAGSYAAMNSTLNWGQSEFGGGWFTTAMHEIGHALGLDHAGDVPAVSIMAGAGTDPNQDAAGSSPEQVFPGDGDITHMQRLYRPDSKDIDLYKFQVDNPGTFNAETVAERLKPTNSLLDSVLTLFEEVDTLNVPLDGGANVRDGDTISITDSTTATTYTFEFDSGRVLRLLGGGSSFSNGQTFTITDDSGNVVTFEFRTSGNAAPGNVRVGITGTSTKAEVAASIAQAINGIASGPGARLAASASFSGRVSVTGDTAMSESIGGLDIFGGYGITAGPNRFAIPFEESMTQAELAQAIADAVNGTAGLNSTATALAEQVQLGGLITTSVSSPLSTLSVTADARRIVARNDDYYSEDSYLELHLEPGIYYTAVTSTGNTNFDPTVADSGFGGTTKGAYNLRLNFSPDPVTQLTDTTGKALDGDADGKAGGAFNFWFQSTTSDTTTADTIFVDKANQNYSYTRTGVLGSLTNPYTFVKDALAVAGTGDIVRVVGDEGGDADLATPDVGALAYEIGLGLPTGPGQPVRNLDDGSKLEVPKDVTLMIDAGAIFKMRLVNIDVGSNGLDRAGGALQVLGTPATPVFFTSYHDETRGNDTEFRSTSPVPSDWGGLVFRNDSDRERQGIFLNYVAGSEIRYGGGHVTVNGVNDVFNPIHMTRSRPTIINNLIVNSADAAMSAELESFEDSKFQDATFTADYERIGPEIHGNRLALKSALGAVLEDNTVNGLFVGIRTDIGSPVNLLDTFARFDDTDIVHYVPDSLIVQGTPAGPWVPAAIAGATAADPIAGNDTVGNFVGTSFPNGTFTSSGGTIGDGPNGTKDVDLYAIDVGGMNGESAGRVRVSIDVSGALNSVVRIFDSSGNQIAIDNPGTYNGSHIEFTPTFVPGSPITRYYVGVSGSGNFAYNANTAASGVAGAIGAYTISMTMTRLDSRLAIDPGTVVKLQGSRLETQFGAQILAEGTAADRIVFTSMHDDRYGAGGTFDTASDLDTTAAAAGDWGGLYFGHTSSGSIDHAYIAYGGGSTKITGGFDRFNAVEADQAELRIANSTFDSNADGAADGARGNRGINGAATVFIRGAQPVIVDNIFKNNLGDVININAGSMQDRVVPDWGRATGQIDAFAQFGDNHGPLVRLNRIGGNQVNGMGVRGGTLNIESVWDDTDIVHVVRSEILVPNLHTFGGLRLQSSPTESLVVKLKGNTAGFTAGGTPLEIDDRIGGTVQVIGTVGHPVVLTSLGDQSVGAGLTPDGLPNLVTDPSATTGGGGGGSGPVFIDGGDRDDHGSFDGTNNLDGWKFIEQALNFVYTQSLNTSSNQILAIGVSGGSAQSALDSAVTQINLNLPTPATVTYVTGAAISTVQFDQFRCIYIPSDEFNTNGGITDTDNGFLTARKDEIQNYVNVTGGGLMALTESTLTTPYAYLELPLPFTIQDGSGDTLVQTPLLAAAGFNITDQEINNGTPWHNSFTGPPGFNNLQIWVTSVQGEVVTLGLPAGSSGIGGTAGAGDWRSVKLTQYSNDRNVAVVNESEGAYLHGIDSNSLVDTSQSLGVLAPNEKAGDDNARLGFEVHGHIALDKPGDVDVYSFQATPGTEVWVDIDRTAHALNTVVELVDEANNVLARSNDSGVETQAVLDTLLLPNSNLARPMDRDAFASEDLYTTNPWDAGFRVVLPATSSGKYFIRVRSNSSNLSVLDGGQSSGEYQLQVRLRELDEFPGSTVRNSDIRYGTTGIDLVGLPAHSYLTGESADNPSDAGNEGQGAAQEIGNLLAVDRNTLSVAGVLNDATDVDWYRFEINYQDVQKMGAGANTWATIFDIDWADNVNGGNATISVFDSQGRLVLMGRDSNIADDRPAPGSANSDLADLSRGSVGSFDPFIGSVQMPEGGSAVYYVAISSDRLLPTAAAATLTGATGASALVRFEPVDGTARIAEDHVGYTDSSISAQATAPLFGAPDGSDFTQTALNLNATPFTLDDVVLYVNSSSQLFHYNPFTGQQVLQVSDPNAGMGGRVNGYFDIAMRNDGRLVALSQGNVDADSGNYHQINTGDGSAVVGFGGDDRIDTLQLEGTNVSKRDKFVPDDGTGIQFEALAFVQTDPNARRLFAVGTDPGGGVGAPFRQNVFYELDPTTGRALYHTPPGSPSPPTDPQPAAFTSFSTSPVIVAGDATRVGAITGASNGAPIVITSVNHLLQPGEIVTITDVLGNTAANGTFTVGAVTKDTFQLVGSDGTLSPAYTSGGTFRARNLTDGEKFTVTRLTSSTDFEFDSGPEISFRGATTANNFRDEQYFVLNGVTFEFNSGPVLVAHVGTDFADEQTFSIWDADEQHFFEFDTDNDGIVNVGYTEIDVAAGDSANTVAANIRAAINGVGGTFTVVASINPTTPSRITLVNDGAGGAASSSTGLDVEGSLAASIFGSQLIPFEETDNIATLQGAIRTAVNTQFPNGAGTGIVATISGDRMAFVGGDSNAVNFSFDFDGIGGNGGAVVAPASKIAPIDEIAGTFNGVAGTSVRIPFGLDDSEATIANKMAAAVNATLGPTVTATVSTRRIDPANLLEAIRSLVTFTNATDASLSDPNRPLSLFGGGPGGKITGMASIGANLYAVTSNGGLYQVIYSPNQSSNGASLNYISTSGPDLLGIGFTGLTNGPPNAQGGAYKNFLFATASDGKLYCFNTSGVLQQVFADGPDADTERETSVDLNLPSAAGLAFSTLDFNLWHATDQRGANPGHGINRAFDNTRNDLFDDEYQGDRSYWFGFEAQDSGDYAVDQPGTGNYVSNQAVWNTYDMPGDAHGSLITNSFSLADYSRADRPVLYFNYFLDTPNASDVLGEGGVREMRDAARVFASTDGGQTWQLLATNNSALDTTPNATGTTQNTELAEFKSISETISLDTRQRVQELYNDGAWRQARVSLGDFAGAANVVLRFDFTTAGATNQGNMPGDAFGNINATARSDGGGRGQDNAHEGFYVDDLIIGLAERGEMVTGGQADAFGFTDLNQAGTRDPAPDLGAQLSGAYQMEIRRGTEYGFQGPPPPPFGFPLPPDVGLAFTIDSNDRLTDTFTLVAPGRFTKTLTQTGDVYSFDNPTIAVPNAMHFEFTDVPVATGAGTLVITATNADLGAASEFLTFDIEGVIIRNIFSGGANGTGSNGGTSTFTLPLTAAQLATLTADGVIHVSVTPSYTDPVFANNVNFIAGNQLTLALDYSGQPVSDGQTFVLNDGINTATFEFDSGGGVTSPHVAVPFTATDTAPQIAQKIVTAINGQTRVAIKASANLSSDRVDLFGVATVDISGSPGLNGFQFESLGDSNLPREQGYTLIEDNAISNSKNFGITVDAGPRDAGTSQTHTGAIRNMAFFPNPDRLVPGLLIENNLLTFNGKGGILFSGDPNDTDGNITQAAVPFGRIVNNTIYGKTTPGGIGIQVSENASPTLLNNIVSNLNVGIDIDASSGSTRVGATIYKANNTNAQGITGQFPLGTFAAILDDAGDDVDDDNDGNDQEDDPLFVDTNLHNFYPAAGSKAIDSSVNSVDERTEMKNVILPLGIRESTILAPDVDLTGAFRADDPNVSDTTGVGGPNVFRDRGALERIGLGTLDITDLTIQEGDAGTQDAVFTVSLSAPSNQVLTVNFSTQAVTATEGEDYLVAGGILVFQPGETVKTISVAVVGDLKDEPNEDFLVLLTDPNTGGILLQGRGTIADDDVPVVTINNVTVNEGSTGNTVNAVFTLTLDQPGLLDATVDFATQDQTATGGLDYNPRATSRLTFLAGQTTQTLVVQVKGDNLDEIDETYLVNLFNFVNLKTNPGGDFAVGTINDDDGPNVSVSDVTVVEGDAPNTIDAVFTISLSSTSVQTVNVFYGTSDGSATDTLDYTGIPFGFLAFTPGQTQKLVTVQVLGDGLDEANETFNLNLFGASDATLLDPLGIGTITDDDGPLVNITDVTVVEGDSGIRNAVFTVSLSNSSPQTITLNFATANGSATSSQPSPDYSATSGSLQFNPGGSLTKTITVQVFGDTRDETNENYFVNLTNLQNATFAVGGDQGLGTITDDDNPDISVTDRTVVEGTGGTKQMVFTIALNTPTINNVDFDYRTVDGTGASGATSPDDFASIATTHVTFTPIVNVANTLQVTVDLVTDAIDEVDENFFLEVFNVVGADPVGPHVTGPDSVRGQGTIDDDDGPTISISDVTVSPEGDSGARPAVFTVSLSAASVQPVLVNVSSANGDALAGQDYTALTTRTLTFAVSGPLSQTVTVNVSGDTLDEVDETFFVNLSAPVDGTILDGQGVGTIDDDDGPEISISDVLVTPEGNSGDKQAIFTVSLSAASVQTVYVTADTADGSAKVIDGDYDAIVGLVRTFLPGETSKLVRVIIHGDTLDEIDENFFVNLSAAIDGEIVDDQGEGVIDDDDGPQLSVSDASLSPEGNSGTQRMVFTVSLSVASTQDVTFNIATQDNTATSSGDYFQKSQNLTIAGGQTQATFTVDIRGDVLDEADETFFVNLTNVANADVLDAQGQGTIFDDDDPPSLSVNDVSVTEGDSGTVNAVFTISLSAPSGLSVSVDFATAGNTATQGTDYTAASGSRTFAPGETAKTVTVLVKADLLDEASETYFLNLSNNVNAGITDGQGLGTILDNDPVPDMTISNVSVTEGNSTSVNAVFTVSLSAPSGRQVTVDYVAADNTAKKGFDYAATSGKLTFAAGQVSRTLTVPVLGDTIDEDNETFFVNLSNAPNAFLADSQGQGTIVDNDAVPSITVSDALIREGDPGDAIKQAKVTVSLSQASGKPVNVSYATRNHSARAGNDYTAKSGTLTFAPGVTTQVVSVDILNDTRKEGNEDFYVDLSTPVNSTIADSRGIVTIDDDDDEVGSLLAAGGANQNPSNPVKAKKSDLPALQAEAIKRWQAAGLGQADLDKMAAVKMRVFNLPGAALGAFIGPKTVIIDKNAAGWGWYIDASPSADSEFPTQTDDHEWQADGAPAQGKFDLLTAVEHELGHAVGYDDVISPETAHDLMSGLLSRGVRRTPEVAPTKTGFFTQGTVLADARSTTGAGQAARAAYFDGLAVNTPSQASVKPSQPSVGWEPATTTVALPVRSRGATARPTKPADWNDSVQAAFADDSWLDDLR